MCLHLINLGSDVIATPVVRPANQPRPHSGEAFLLSYWQPAEPILPVPHGVWRRLALGDGVARFGDLSHMTSSTHLHGQPHTTCRHHEGVTRALNKVYS